MTELTSYIESLLEKARNRTVRVKELWKVQMSRNKICIIMPAYNAFKTIDSVFSRLLQYLRHIERIIVVDDGSNDGTVKKLVGWKSNLSVPVNIFQHKTNRGYGAAQKVLLTAFLQVSYSKFALLLHADGQYPPEAIPEVVKATENNDVGMILASRALGARMREGGMPAVRYCGNRLLTRLENLVFRQHISEYHTGMRAYSRKFIRNVPFWRCSDRFSFDTDIILQCLLSGFPISEIAIPTVYTNEESHLNAISYGIRIFQSIGKFLGHKLLHQSSLMRL